MTDRLWKLEDKPLSHFNGTKQFIIFPIVITHSHTHQFSCAAITQTASHLLRHSYTVFIQNCIQALSTHVATVCM